MSKKGICLSFLTCILYLLLSLCVSQSHAAEKITFYHYDLLGSPVAATNEKGDVLWREEYSPYGDKLLNQDAASDNARGYTGHVHDTETGLTYMQARYYDPEIGRFMSVDPVGFKEENPVSFNRYAYANNNPYKYTDPNGMESDDGFGEDFGDLIGLGPDAVSLADEFAAERAENSITADLDTVSVIDPFAKMKGAVLLGGIIRRAPKRTGDLTASEIKQIQKVVNEAGRPLEVVGSAAKGTRRGVGSNLPVGKGKGKKSDIDVLIPPSSKDYFVGLKNKLPDADINIGTANPHIGPSIRFEPQ